MGQPNTSRAKVAPISILKENMEGPETPNNLIENLEFWMTNLPKSLRKKPFIHLAIPGSHDSMTSSISSHSKVAPDAEDLVQCLQCLGPITRTVISRWAKTQSFDVTEQLLAGIRYFDLRIATKKGTDELFFVHGLYADGVLEIFNGILNFLDGHPKEVIILDCQHFYELTFEDHQTLMDLITGMFRGKLVPYMGDMSGLTLDYLTESNEYQIFVIYRSDAAQYNQPLLWPSSFFPTPWPNTDKIPILFDKLTANLKHRSPNYAYVSQCVLTPSTQFVTRHLLSSLKSQCAIPLQKKQYEWLAKQQPGPNGVNIIINDFVDLSDGEFARKVISLNAKLL